MTDDPRYPVGPFASSGRPLTPEEREACFLAIERHPGNMRAAVAGLDDGQLDTPYRDGGWSVRQVVHHVVDSHVNSYCRFKLIATEESPTIRTYDQDAWASLPDSREPVEMSLRILDAVHARWVVFLRAMEPSYFRRSFNHPEVGEMTCDALLELYRWHCEHHEGHVTGLRTREGW